MGAHTTPNANVGRRHVLAGTAAAAMLCAVPARANHYVSIEGLWLLRAFRNLPDRLEDYDRLRLATGAVDITLYTETDFIGVLTGADYHLNLFGTWNGERFTMRATQGSPNTTDWCYEYSGWLTPHWINARADQATTFVGTALRLADHGDLRGGTLRGGESFSFVGIRHAPAPT